MYRQPEGTVKLSHVGHDCSLKVTDSPTASDVGLLPPDEERLLAELSVVGRAQEMSPNAKEVLHDAMNSEKALGPPTDLNRLIWCSRCRVGKCEASARLLAYLLVSCRTEGIMLLLAAP